MPENIKDPQEFVGLLSELGASGGSSGGEDWSLVWIYAAWKEIDGAINQDEICVTLPMPYDEMERLRLQWRPYQQVHIEGRICQYSDGRSYIEASSLINPEACHKNLSKLAVALKKPVVIEDRILGKLVLDRGMGRLEGERNWCRETIYLVLDCPYGDQALLEQAIKHARSLWNGASKWNDRLKSYAADHMLEFKNDVWADDQPVTREEFISQMKPSSVLVKPDGSFSVGYKDGWLFGGHGIDVAGSVNHGPTSAGIL